MVDLLDTYLENRELVQPNHANNLDTAHGGNVMMWMDVVGAMTARRFAGETCVTARVNQMNFKRPIPVGETVLISAYVYHAGRTSVRVRLAVDREDFRTGERERTTESVFVFVAIDDEGQPTPVPELTVRSEEGARLREEAIEADGDLDPGEGSGAQ